MKRPRPACAPTLQGAGGEAAAPAAQPDGPLVVEDLGPEALPCVCCLVVFSDCKALPAAVYVSYLAEERAVPSPPARQPCPPRLIPFCAPFTPTLPPLHAPCSNQYAWEYAAEAWKGIEEILGDFMSVEEVGAAPAHGWGAGACMQCELARARARRGDEVEVEQALASNLHHSLCSAHAMPARFLPLPNAAAQLTALCEELEEEWDEQAALCLKERKTVDGVK